MATVKGIWKFSDTINMYWWAENADATKEYVNFKSYRSADEPAYSYIGFNLQHYGTLDNLQFLKTTTTADRSYVWQKRSTDTYELGWQYEERRIIDFGETAQHVSDEFYFWFIVNAKCISGNTKPLSGIWLLNETLETPPFSIFDISFRSDGKRCTYFDCTFSSYAKNFIGFQYNTPVDSIDAYLFQDYSLGNLKKGWQLEAYRTIDFGGAEQLAFEQDYEWFIANAIYVGKSDEEPTATATITYNGNVIATITDGQTATIPCEGKKMVGDIVIAYGGEEDDSSTTLIEFWIIPPGQSFHGSDDWYQAESGMTWLDWCNSEYNTRGYFCYDAGASSVWDSKGEYKICTSSQTAVDAKESIISGHSYVLISTSTDLGGSN
jgi:hypothetical protein